MTEGADLVLPESHSRGRGRRVLERARVRVPLIRDLAAADATLTDLAETYDVTPPAILAFGRRHREEIERCRAGLENELAAYWIAQKANRIGEYQDDVERINDLMDETGELDAGLIRAKHNAVRSVAEETGALRTVVDSTVTVGYVLTGVDVSALT